MKSKTLKLVKIFASIVFIIGLMMVLAIIWPLPDIKPPIRHSKVFVKSINIIDVASGTVLENRDVLIKDNIILAIDTLGVIQAQPTSFTIDGTGKYLIPGLWDMHTHSSQHSKWYHHPLFIANGVTGIRDMSGQLNKKDSYFAGSEERLLWNEELRDNKRITPRYVLQSSFQMDGRFSVPEGFPDYFKLQKVEDVDSLLRFYKKEKVDFIKVYDQIPSASYIKLTQEAPKFGIHVAGHKPMFVSLSDAITLGQRSFEHGRIFLYECFPNADSLRRANNWKAFITKSRGSMIREFKPEVAKRLMQQMKQYNTHWCPTLQTLKFEAFAHDSIFLQNPNLKYINYISKKLWWDVDVQNNKKKNLSKEGESISAAFYEAAKAHVKLASDLGVPILAGTDVTDSYIFAGFSLHDELEDLTKSGLSDLEALQSATIVAAKYAGMDKDYGTIEIGKTADLVILNRNPLDDITNTKTIYGVVMNGTYYDSGKIEELKAFTQSLSSSFHMNVKVLFSLIRSPLIRLQWAD